MSGVYTVIAVATALSVNESRKSRKQAKKAAKVAEKSNRLQSGRDAAEQVRQAQIARASVLQQGENQGVGDSTAVAGAVGSIQSQAGGNIGFANQIFSFQQSRQRLLDSANTHAGKSAAWGQVASIASGFSGDSSSPSGGSSPSGTGTVMNDNFKGIYS